MTRPLIEYFSRLVLASGLLGTRRNAVTLLLPPNIPPPIAGDREIAADSRSAFKQALGREEAERVGAACGPIAASTVPLNVFDFTVSHHRDGPDDVPEGLHAARCWAIVTRAIKGSRCAATARSGARPARRMRGGSVRGARRVSAGSEPAAGHGPATLRHRRSRQDVLRRGAAVAAPARSGCRSWQTAARVAGRRRGRGGAAQEQAGRGAALLAAITGSRCRCT